MAQMTAAALTRILYVDDDPDIRQVAKLALGVVGGFTLECCSCAEEALRALPQFRPDLILLDVMMPGMDGPTTLAKLRELPEASGIPAMFMTAKVQPQEIAGLEHDGVLGVIAKPFDPMTLAQTVRKLWSAGTAQVVPRNDASPRPPPAGNANALEQITEEFVRSLPGKLEEIASLWRSVNEEGAPPDLLDTLHRKVHSLVGSAGTFGLGRVAEAARALERELKRTSGTRPSPNLGDSSQLAGLVHELVCSAGQSRPSASPAPALPPSISGPADSADENKAIYLFADQAEWADGLSDQLENYGFEVRSLHSPEELAQACARRVPAAVMTQLESQRLYRVSGQAASRSRESSPAPPPVIFISDRDDLDSRLQAAQAGGVAYFTLPVKVSSLVDRLDQLCVRKETEPYRVMIVEDAEEQSAFYSAVLTQAGMLTCVVSDPRRLLEQLEEFHPEFVLMDMYLPQCSGDDLARVIRQMDAFVSLPIVFLSVETDFDRQLSAMELGGDEFLTKPILPAQLVSVVASRVKRYRTLRALMIQDSLTGLANHSRLHQLLETEVARALRQNRPLSLAMIDVDHFKQVNDRHGHPTGDRILQELARFLRQRLRQADVVARYGGEEFAVVMSNTEGANALMVMDRLRNQFATLTHESDKGESFPVTFSAGVAELSGLATARELVLAADRALYQAKDRGRNCAVLRSAEPTADKAVEA
ncbi:MAG TPA: response regulator [Burkholderiales bacterium]|nr:response regulator [Burkholderiales bacterium]